MSTLTKEKIYEWLEEVPDPEVPVLSILDLGIVRDVAVHTHEEKVEAIITITPTYSGCPAMDLIATQIRLALMGRGVHKVTISTQLQPAWTTDWMTETGKEKLKAYGIAPPKRQSKDGLALFEQDEIPCPRCNSTHTELISQFGSTSCKAMYRCLDCKEPFEHFKCH